MKVIYTSPNGKWKLVENSDFRWNEIFGESKHYLLCKRREGCLSTSEDEMECFEISCFFENAASAFKWLRWARVISSDEMTYQIGLFNNAK